MKQKSGRRKVVLERLENQLKKGTKPQRISEVGHPFQSQEAPLTESDKKRIEKEIQTLKSRI
jgi:hypothetical protein